MVLCMCGFVFALFSCVSFASSPTLDFSEKKKSSGYLSFKVSRVPFFYSVFVKWGQIFFISVQSGIKQCSKYLQGRKKQILLSVQFQNSVNTAPTPLYKANISVSAKTLLTSQSMEDFGTAAFKNVTVKWWWSLLFQTG